MATAHILLEEKLDSKKPEEVEAMDRRYVIESLHASTTRTTKSK